jgi:hypothetical protein
LPPRGLLAQLDTSFASEPPSLARASNGMIQPDMSIILGEEDSRKVGRTQTNR